MPASRPAVELDLPFAQAVPDRLRPMLPMSAAAPFDSTEYCFDVAWDGIRALASIDRGEVRLWGRDLADLTSRYPEVQALATLAPPETVVDGELIVSDADGRPDPVALDKRQHANGAPGAARAAAAHPVTYVVYDLLYLRGRSMLKEPLVRRRPRMFDAIQSSGRIYVVEPVADDGLALFDAARERGLEGVVAKRFDSPYRAGRRHPDWLQIDAVRREDFVVLGFLPQAGDQLLDALIVGTYDGRAFHPAGRVVGSFDRATSIRLRRKLDALPSRTAPANGPWSDDRICWVAPQVVVNVRFSEWDRHGQLRFPLFNGLRPEVAPQECVRTPVVEPPQPARPRRVEIQLPRLPI
jgi:bifunctional non-homologous end joining protein LigD